MDMSTLVTKESLLGLKGIGDAKADEILEFCDADMGILAKATPDSLVESSSLSFSLSTSIIQWAEIQLIAEDMSENMSEDIPTAKASSDGVAKSFDDIAVEDDTKVEPQPIFQNANGELEDSGPSYAIGPDDPKVDLSDKIVDPLLVPDEREYITKHVKVDAQTIARTRVELTPAVCRTCAWDILEHHSLGDWDSIPLKEQAKIRVAMKHHTILEHPASGQDIVRASELLTSNLKTSR